MEIKNYYGRRAEEYEQIYNRDDPVRQAELNGIKKEMTLIFAGRSVLEAACGTGHFTEVISRSAKVITAFDFSPEVIEVAKSKNLNAYFLIDDAYEMKNITGSFDAGCEFLILAYTQR